MILCPNCKHHETSGALFCSECGIPITEVSDDSTQTAKYSQENSKTIENFQQTAFPPSQFESIEGLSLFLINNEKMIDLAGKNEYTIGRATDSFWSLRFWYLPPACYNHSWRPNHYNRHGVDQRHTTKWERDSASFFKSYFSW